jgi:hypothetical protein
MFNDLGIQATSRKMQDFTQSSKIEKAAAGVLLQEKNQTVHV